MSSVAECSAQNWPENLGKSWQQCLPSYGHHRDSPYYTIPPPPPQFPSSGMPLRGVLGVMCAGVCVHVGGGEGKVCDTGIAYSKLIKQIRSKPRKRSHNKYPNIYNFIITRFVTNKLSG